jgi:beta-glucosidase
MAPVEYECTCRDVEVRESSPTNIAIGTATSAYQVEGAWDENGRGESVWDRFAHTPGKIANGDTGDVACDHYHRWRDDIGLMSQLGVNAYCFSISWPRVFPDGWTLNEAGLDFYDELTDGLLEAGITPYPEMHHWDTPQALQDEGGWADRSTVDAFVEFTNAVAARLGDRADHWVTINEPRVTVQQGYQDGSFAPGIIDLPQSLVAGHHLLLGHGRATSVINSYRPDAKIGLCLDTNPVVAASPEHEAAAYLRDGLQNRWYLDPLAGRGYPEDVVDHLAVPMDFIQPGDLDDIATPIGFMGINYYRREIEGEGDIAPLPLTDMGWEIYPDGLRDALIAYSRDYPFPAYYVTENGAAYPDVPSGGEVHDPDRIAYLERHFKAAAEAIEAGVNLKGYFVWSLMDNFEWADGLGKRFGLIHVDFETQERIVKDSGKWLKEFIAGATG